MDSVPYTELECEAIEVCTVPIMILDHWPDIQLKWSTIVQSGARCMVMVSLGFHILASLHTCSRCHIHGSILTPWDGS